MTYEEALKRVNEMLEKRALVFSAIYKISFWSMIQEALEKQVAKKSKHKNCPNCNTDFSFITENLANPKGHKIIYCWNCGQAIDW